MGGREGRGKERKRDYKHYNDNNNIKWFWISDAKLLAIFDRNNISIFSHKVYY